MNLPEKIYTEKDVARAKDRAQVVGWLQGDEAPVRSGAPLGGLRGRIPGS